MIQCEQLITSRRNQGGSSNPAKEDIKSRACGRYGVSPHIQSTVAKWEKSLEPDGLFIKFKQQITKFHWRFIYSIDVHNTNILILWVVYLVYSKYWEGMRWEFRGITGEGNGETWKGLRMDIQRYNGRGKMGLGKRKHALKLFCRHLFIFSSSAFGIAGIREEAAGLQRQWEENCCNSSSQDRSRIKVA